MITYIGNFMLGEDKVYCYQYTYSSNVWLDKKEQSVSFFKSKKGFSYELDVWYKTITELIENLIVYKVVEDKVVKSSPSGYTVVMAETLWNNEPCFHKE